MLVLCLYVFYTHKLYIGLYLLPKYITLQTILYKINIQIEKRLQYVLDGVDYEQEFQIFVGKYIQEKQINGMRRYKSIRHKTYYHIGVANVAIEIINDFVFLVCFTRFLLFFSSKEENIKIRNEEVIGRVRVHFRLKLIHLLYKNYLFYQESALKIVGFLN